MSVWIFFVQGIRERACERGREKAHPRCERALLASGAVGAYQIKKEPDRIAAAPATLARYDWPRAARERSPRRRSQRSSRTRASSTTGPVRAGTGTSAAAGRATAPIQFMILSQAIIFVLGWPLEWTEIIVIFMPIFLPLLGHFQIDPLFFGLLVALNLQTAFLSPPVAMSAFYIKGVAPPHVTLNQIFAGMLPFMAIQVLAVFLLYMFPGIGLWLPSVLYR